MEGRQEDQGDGSSREACAKRGQHDAPVEAIRKPADRDLEGEPADHGYEHGQRDGFAPSSLVLHPRRNERIERARDEPVDHAADDCERCCMQKLTIRQFLRDGHHRRLGPGHAHDDQRYGEQSDDCTERLRSLELDPANQELSHG